VNSVELSRRQYRAKSEVGLVLPEGVETRGWVPTITPPRAPNTIKSEDIVRTAWRHVEVVIKKAAITTLDYGISAIN